MAGAAAAFGKWQLAAVWSEGQAAGMAWVLFRAGWVVLSLLKPTGLRADVGLMLVTLSPEEKLRPASDPATNPSINTLVAQLSCGQKA